MKSETTALIFSFSYASFLLSFPNFGPVAIKLMELKNIDSYMFFIHFYAAHVLGIAFAAIFLDKIVERFKLLKVATTFTIFSALLTLVNFQMITVVGFSMGIMVVILGSFFARFVEPWKRGKLFAVGAFLANLYFFFFFIYKPAKDLNLLLAFSVLPLLLFYVLPNFRFEKTEGYLNRIFAYFSFPVLVFYLTGGIMYGLMEPVFRNAGIEVHVLFYAFLILLAGYIYDSVGRRSVAIIGLLALSASLLFFPSKLELSAYLIQSSYAFIDVFAMMIWADISAIGSEARQYGIGMLFITIPILVGFMLTKLFAFQMSTIFATFLLIFSAFLIGSLKEPAISPEEYMRWLSRR